MYTVCRHVSGAGLVRAIAFTPDRSRHSRLPAQHTEFSGGIAWEPDHDPLHVGPAAVWGTNDDATSPSTGPGAAASVLSTAAAFRLSSTHIAAIAQAHRGGWRTVRNRRQRGAWNVSACAASACPLHSLTSTCARSKISEPSAESLSPASSCRTRSAGKESTPRPNEPKNGEKGACICAFQLGGAAEPPNAKLHTATGVSAWAFHAARICTTTAASADVSNPGLANKYRTQV